MSPHDLAVPAIFHRADFSDAGESLEDYKAIQDICSLPWLAIAGGGSENPLPLDRISGPATQNGRGEDPQIADECLVLNIMVIGLGQSLGRRHVY
jgi:hypothetical protein